MAKNSTQTSQSPDSFAAEHVPMWHMPHRHGVQMRSIRYGTSIAIQLIRDQLLHGRLRTVHLGDCVARRQNMPPVDRAFGGHYRRVLHEHGRRTAADVARVTWLLDGVASASGCQPSVTTLAPAGFEVRCAAQISYVRCAYTSSATCCWTVPTRAEAAGGTSTWLGRVEVCD